MHPLSNRKRRRAKKWTSVSPWAQANSPQLAMNGNGGGAAAALGGLYQQHQTPQHHMGGMAMHTPGQGSGSGSVSTHHVVGRCRLNLSNPR